MHMSLAADASAAAAWKALEGVEAHPLHDYRENDLSRSEFHWASAGIFRSRMPGRQNSPAAAGPNSQPWTGVVAAQSDVAFLML